MRAVSLAGKPWTQTLIWSIIHIVALLFNQILLFLSGIITVSAFFLISFWEVMHEKDQLLILAITGVCDSIDLQL